jgi:hypothetical protein
MPWSDFNEVRGNPCESKAGNFKHPKEKEPKTRAQLESALDASARILAISAEIRERSGLQPLAPSLSVRLWSDRLRNMAPAKVRKVAAKHQVSLTPDKAVADIARRRKALDRERMQLDREIAALVETKAVKVSRIAQALGISRQRVYQLAG